MTIGWNSGQFTCYWTRPEQLIATSSKWEAAVRCNQISSLIGQPWFWAAPEHLTLSNKINWSCGGTWNIAINHIQTHRSLWHHILQKVPLGDKSNVIGLLQKLCKRLLKHMTAMQRVSLQLQSDDLTHTNHWTFVLVHQRVQPPTRITGHLFLSTKEYNHPHKSLNICSCPPKSTKAHIILQL